MAFASARNAQFTIAGTDISAYTDSVGGIQNTTDMLEVTAFGATSKSFVGGLRNGDTITISGKWDPAVNTALSALLGSASTSAWIYGPAGSTTGNVKFSGNCLVKTYEVQAQVANVLTWSATLQISGNVTIGTY
jgi:hypothetical protein